MNDLLPVYKVVIVLFIPNGWALQSIINHKTAIGRYSAGSAKSFAYIVH
jgi:hypothetical protein